MDFGAKKVSAVMYIPDVGMIFEAFAEMIRDRGMTCRLDGTNLEDDEGYKRIAASWKVLEDQVRRMEMGKSDDGVVFIWDIDFSTLIGKKIHIETSDGLNREGNLKSIEWGEPIKLFGREIRLPISMRFSDDFDDIVDFNRIKTVNLVTPGPSSAGTD